MSVTITKPASGATLTGLAVVEATYSGKNFEIATVTVDGQQLGSDSAKPIAFSIDTTKVADGPHTLTVAVRYRTAGGAQRWQKASIPIRTEGNDMKVNLSTSGGVSDLTGTVTVTAVVTPSAQAETPVSCKFSIDNGPVLSTDTSYPLTFSWNTTSVGDGNHVIRAVVTAGPRTRQATGALSVSVLNIPAPPPPPPPDPPVNITLPTISDTTPLSGQVLTANPGTWENNPTSYTYQWMGCTSGGTNCLPIPGATASSYAVESTYVGDALRVRVIANNTAGPSLAATSDFTSDVAAPAAAVPVNTVAPSVTGVATVGQTLSSSTGNWTNQPTSYAYKWQRGTVDIAGATSSTYTLVTADAGSTIRCGVIASNGTGAGTIVYSAATGVVQAAPPPPPPPPSYWNELWEGAVNGVVPTGWAQERNTFGVGSNTHITWSFPTDPLGQKGKVLLLKNAYDSAKPTDYTGGARQLVSLYKGAGSAHGAYNVLNEETWYRVDVMFPTGCVFADGESNMIVEWHTDSDTQNGGVYQAQGIRGNSPCVMVGLAGPFTSDGTTTPPGIVTRWNAGPLTNQQITYWPSADGSGSWAQKIPVAYQANHWYVMKWRVVWSTNPMIGRMEWYVDGVQKVARMMATLYVNTNLPNSSSYNTFGLYDYRYNVTGTSSIHFDRCTAGPTLASIGG